MRAISTNIRQLLLACVLCLSLSACFPNRNSKPDLGISYNEVCERIDSAEALSSANHHSSPSDFKTGTVAHDISAAREFIDAKRNNYARYFCEQEWSNRHFNYSLIGTALAAGGAAIARANPYVLSGIGLFGGGISGLKTYQHPDTDRDASMKAYEQLTCIYDQTRVLDYNIVVSRLEFDRGALHAAMGAVSNDLAKIPAGASKQTAADKAASAAGKAAIDAGRSALTQIATSLGDYKKMPGLIDHAANSIDVAARSANTTSGSYSGFQSTIKDAYTAAAKDSAGKESAANAVASANGAAAVAGAVAASQPKAPSDALKDMLFSSKHLDGALFASVRDVCATGKACGKIEMSSFKAIDSTTGAELGASVALADPTQSDIAKLTSIAEASGEDLPSPLYSEVIASITACTPKQ